MIIGFGIAFLIMMGVIVGHIISIERRLDRELSNNEDTAFWIIPSAIVLFILHGLLLLITILGI